MAEDIVDFLDGKGAVELFLVISPLGSRFTDLKDELPITSTTLSNRLDEAEELGLITQLPSSEPQYRKQHYLLTKRGEYLQDKAWELRLPRLYRQIRELKYEYNGGVEAFIEQIDDEADAIWERPAEITDDSKNCDE